MSDTTLQDCTECGHEGDCINGVCFECSETTKQSNQFRKEEINKLRGKNKRLKEKNEVLKKQASTWYLEGGSGIRHPLDMD